VPYCDSLGLLKPGTSIAHAVDLLPDELDVLAERGCAVVHCPRGNMKLASGVAPVPAMLERGIPVGLGTDGAAGSNTLNLFSVMTAAALLHKVHGGDPTLLPAQTVLDLATLGGAVVLQQPDLGRIEAGSLADIIAVDLTVPNLVPLHSLASNLVYAATGHEVRLTMVGGEVLYLDGGYSLLDLPSIRRAAQKAAEELRSG
jgi:5-methylthioadenosine/S-adenosylhomocysteine deaminase